MENKKIRGFILITAIAVFFLILIIYGYYNYLASITDRKQYTKALKLTGFATEEITQEDGNIASWTRDSAVKKVLVSAENAVIPVYTLKPDIETAHQKVNIKINDNIIGDFELTNNEIVNLSINVKDYGYKPGDVMDISFEVDNLWDPEGSIKGADGNIGIAVGEIYFFDK